MDGLRTYGECTFPRHYDQAWRWVNQQSWRSCYANEHRLDLEGGLKGVLQFIGLSGIRLVGDTTNQWAYNTFNATYPPGSRYPHTPISASSKISISKWCTSVGVLRAAILHEIVEVYAAIRCYKRTISNANDPGPHYTACSYLERIECEKKGSEDKIRDSNVESCLSDLRAILFVIEKAKGKNDSLYRKVDTLRNHIAMYSYIPGYCEPYIKRAYRDSQYSSFAKTLKDWESKLCIYPCYIDRPKS